MMVERSLVTGSTRQRQVLLQPGHERRSGRPRLANVALGEFDRPASEGSSAQPSTRPFVRSAGVHAGSRHASLVW